MMLHHPQGSSRTVYHHHWRTSEGVWHSEALPFTGHRPKLVGTEDRTLFLVYTRGDQLRIAMGIPNPDRSAWKWSDIKRPDPHPCYGDALLDLERWNSESILSIYSQHPPGKVLRTKKTSALDGHPSPLHVADYRLDQRHLR